MHFNFLTLPFRQSAAKLFTNDNFLDWTKLKAFADGKINTIQKYDSCWNG